MAERKSSKARTGPKTAAAKKPVAVAARASKATSRDPLVSTVERLETSVAELKRQRDAIEAELDVARARIEALEAARIDAVNRIDWVLDSLESVLQTKS